MVRLHMRLWLWNVHEDVVIADESYEATTICRWSASNKQVTPHRYDALSGCVASFAHDHFGEPQNMPATRAVFQTNQSIRSLRPPLEFEISSS